MNWWFLIWTCSRLNNNFLRALPASAFQGLASLEYLWVQSILFYFHVICDGSLCFTMCNKDILSLFHLKAKVCHPRWLVHSAFWTFEPPKLWTILGAQLSKRQRKIILQVVASSLTYWSPVPAILFHYTWSHYMICGVLFTTPVAYSFVWITLEAIRWLVGFCTPRRYLGHETRMPQYDLPMDWSYFGWQRSYLYWPYCWYCANQLKLVSPNTFQGLTKLKGL